MSRFDFTFVGIHSWRMILRTKLAAASAVVAAATVLAPPALAQHGNFVYGHVSSRNWSLCVNGGAAQNAVDTGIARINATAVNVTRGCSGSNNAIIFVGDYPDAWYGYAICSGTQSGSSCSRMAVYLNTRVAVAAQQRAKSMTHELGHAAGLEHRNGDNGTVMAQGESPPVSEFYDTHDVRQIGLIYP